MNTCTLDGERARRPLRDGILVAEYASIPAKNNSCAPDGPGLRAQRLVLITRARPELADARTERELPSVP